MHTKIVTSCGACVVTYIENTPHILLVRPSSVRDVWGIPKGHIEQGETYYECAIRETYEETGIVPKLLVPLPTVKTSYKTETKFVKSYLAVPANPEFVIRGDGENFDIKFFAINQLPTIHPYQSTLIAGAVFLIKQGVLENDRHRTS